MIVEQVKDSEFLNSKNGEGMTVLHLAVLAKQIEVSCRAFSTSDLFLHQKYE